MVSNSFFSNLLSTTASKVTGLQPTTKPAWSVLVCWWHQKISNILLHKIEELNFLGKWFCSSTCIQIPYWLSSSVWCQCKCSALSVLNLTTAYIQYFYNWHWYSAIPHEAVLHITKYDGALLKLTYCSLAGSYYYLAGSKLFTACKWFHNPLPEAHGLEADAIKPMRCWVVSFIDCTEGGKG